MSTNQNSEQAETVQEQSGEVLTTRRTLTGLNVQVVYWMGVLMSLYHLWVNTIGIMPNIQRNAVHFSFVCFLGYLIYPMCRRVADRTLWLDYILAVLSFGAGMYLILFEDALHARNEVPILSDLIFAGLAIVLMIEITRRVTGYVIPILSVTFLGYAMGLGNYLSGVWKFPGVTLERMLYRMYFAPDGIFGKIATISSTYVFLFVLFAAFLLQSGAGNFIIRLSLALMGRLTGGPAKMAIFASGLMGSISGSAVANTVGTGSITIPLMKRIGLKPHFAGGVEAAASTGGQLLPPIMGAGAFIMSQWTQIPYLTIVGVAILPALMYFLSIAFFIHLRAKRQRLKVLSYEEMPSLKQVLKEGWNFFIPIGVLIFLLIKGYTPTYAASAGILAIVLASWINPHTRMGIKDILDALSKGANNMVTTGVILLCSGIIVGIVLMVGAGMKFSMLITSIAGGSLFLTIVLVALASLILGMGLPVTASYIVLAVLTAPSMTMLGTSVIGAHMLIFWFSQDANVTPPVCLAAYAASGVAGSKPLATGFESWKLAKGLYIIPLLFVYSPLLFQGPTWTVLETTALGTLGLYCTAAFFEGYHLFDLHPIMRLVMLGTGGLMLWPSLTLHGAGVASFVLASVVQLIIKHKQNPEDLAIAA